MLTLPAVDVLAAYTLACLVLFITPGPDMSLWLSKTLQGGRTAGIASVLGTAAGTCVHTAVAALGLSALLAASATAFGVLQIVGAVYLLWLAFDAIRHGATVRPDSIKPAPVPPWRTFLAGLVVNLTNPKVVLFFVTFLPQFVASDDPQAGAKLLVLGLWFVVLNTPLGILLVLAAGSIVETWRTRPRLVRAIDWIFAGVFGAFAVKILMLRAG